MQAGVRRGGGSVERRPAEVLRRAATKARKQCGAEAAGPDPTRQTSCRCAGSTLGPVLRRRRTLRQKPHSDRS